MEIAKLLCMCPATRLHMLLLARAYHFKLLNMLGHLRDRVRIR
jgi:hypothetical protein